MRTRASSMSLHMGVDEKHDMSWHGMVVAHGMAWRGVAWHAMTRMAGMAWRGRHGMAWQAWHGMAWHGMA